MNLDVMYSNWYEITWLFQQFSVHLILVTLVLANNLTFNQTEKYSHSLYETDIGKLEVFQGNKIRDGAHILFSYFY